MKININTKELIKGLLVICSYFLLTIILQIPFIFLYQLKLINRKDKRYDLIKQGFKALYPNASFIVANKEKYLN